jgi:hypothetical protein
LTISRRTVSTEGNGTKKKDWQNKHTQAQRHTGHKSYST